jgi:hypothetical protein
MAFSIGMGCHFVTTSSLSESGLSHHVFRFRAPKPDRLLDRFAMAESMRFRILSTKEFGSICLSPVNFAWTICVICTNIVAVVR